MSQVLCHTLKRWVLLSPLWTLWLSRGIVRIQTAKPAPCLGWASGCLCCREHASYGSQGLTFAPHNCHKKRASFSMAILGDKECLCHNSWTDLLTSLHLIGRNWSYAIPKLIPSAKVKMWVTTLDQSGQTRITDIGGGVEDPLTRSKPCIWR